MLFSVCSVRSVRDWFYTTCVTWITIILNGTSSSGKSTLARVLQDRAPEAFFVITGDEYMEMLGRSKYVDMHDEAYVQYNLVECYTAKALSDIGMNLIIDTLFLKGETENKTLWCEIAK